MNRRAILAVWATAATAVPLAALSHADPPYQWQVVEFQSPDGNIHCHLINDHGKGIAACQITDYTYAVPQPPGWCAAEVDAGRWFWGDILQLEQGEQPFMQCHGSSIGPGGQALDYGQTRSLLTMTCDSEPTGMTCTDSSTGHYFRTSRESYDGG
ncbi:MAG: hypothetical protein JWR32_6123 [Mycobacterium sp.]|nr:hypothetical protein [Mycobacterium sp.]